MIPALAALLLQAAAAPATPAPVSAATQPTTVTATAKPIAPAQSAASVAKPVPPLPALKPLDLQIALDTFKALCWAHLRAPDELRAAIPSAAIPLAELPHPRPGPTTVWRADEAVLSYTAADDLPPGVPSRQCTLRTRLAGPADQLALAARVSAALALHGGGTRTLPSGAQTTWTIPQPDGHTLRLIVATANAARGQTDLRQLLLLLSPDPATK